MTGLYSFLIEIIRNKVEFNLIFISKEHSACTDLWRSPTTYAFIIVPLSVPLSYFPYIGFWSLFFITSLKAYINDRNNRLSRDHKRTGELTAFPSEPSRRFKYFRSRRFQKISFNITQFAAQHRGKRPFVELHRFINFLDSWGHEFITCGFLSTTEPFRSHSSIHVVVIICSLDCDSFRSITLAAKLTVYQ